MEDKTEASIVTVKMQEDLYLAFMKIMDHTKPEKFIKLSDWICNVAGDTGFGEIRIIVRDGHMDYFRIVKADK